MVPYWYRYQRPLAGTMILGYVAAVLLLLLDATTGMAFFNRPDGAQESLTTPKLVSHSNSDWRRHKRSVAVVPDHVTVRMSVAGENVDLWVTRSEDNTLNVQHHHLTDQPHEDFPHQNVELYSNATSKAVLVVYHPDISTDNVKVTGSFQHGFKSYHIQPLDSSFDATRNDFRHTVWTFDSEASRGKENYTEQIPKILHRNKRNSFSMRLENTVEIFAVVDYKDYTEYATRFQTSGTAAKALITSNLAYSVESANMHLQSLRKQIREAVIRVCLVGVMILTDHTRSSFTENNVRDNVLDEASAITDFRRFLNENQQRLPKADHFLAVTAYQLGRSSDILAREARIGSMCSADSITLIRDRQGGVNGRSIAHGLGHSLGALNDEEYSDDSCSREYTMAQYQTGLDNLNNKGHTFLFSRCSAEEINSRLLRPTSNNSDHRLVDEAVGLFQFFTGTQEFGLQDFYSFDFFEDKCFNAICSVGIFCRIPFSANCRSVPSFEKLSCGNRKWCVGSRCVANSTARATNGDDVVAYDKINFPCDRRLCPTFRKNLGVLYNANCPLTCPRGTFTCPNVFNVQFPP
ncbi:A disintegrin and metalloproteinase with thrombospondin motifs 17 [Elysia marginata]|uniref:A disintegrin and metalloproteinase with thrombospondin motifs 17 n=1 Tax=Elysia marginata TaxID=1093978 RepID=A0AAV4J295_9GAST|nr:A disintegrin and metalloproteinase with thrombospondin motifs 17 [Elysia marginata]